MATKRIKDITNTATTFASDDFIALDGSTQGTRKMDKDDLISQVSAGVSGDYLEEANNLSDVASKDTSKLNLEVPDVGTAPNEVPLNGQLGSMAYQSAEAVSVDKLEVTDKLGVGVNPSGNPLEVAGTNGNFSIAADGNTANFSRNAANYIAATADTSSSLSALAKHSFQVHTGNPTVEALRVDSSQRVGIGTSSPGSFNAAADDLCIGDSSGDRGITVSSGDAGTGNLFFGDATSGAIARGAVSYDHSSNALSFTTAAATAVTIDSAGNVIVASGDVTATTGQFNSGASNASGPAFAVSTGNGIYNSGANQIGFSTNSTKRWTIDSSGNLVANSTGIDFSSTSDGSGTASSEVLSDYEEGTWTPVYTPTVGSFAAITMNVVAARYVKIGHQVTVNCYIQTTNLDTTGASGLVTVTGLPYANAGSNNYTAANIGYAIDWTEAPAGGHVSTGSSEIVLNKRYTSITGFLSSMSVSDLNTASGSKNTIMLTATYNSF